MMDFIMVLRDETLRKLGVNLSDDFMLNLEKMLEIVKQFTPSRSVSTRKLHEFPRVKWLFK